MEGQQFNPTAGPAPEPQPQPQPQPQPMQSAAGWQPTQATAPQVGGMDNPVALTVPPEAPKKSNKGLLFGIMFGAVLIAGIVIAIVLLSGQNGTTAGGEAGSGSGGESGKTESLADEKLKLRNQMREDDLARYLVAVNDYRTNHSGKTPFGTKYNQSELGLFVHRYIDEGISETGAPEGKAFPCNRGSCVMFTDVDGTSLGWTVNVAVNGKTNESISYKNENKPDHILHVYVKALCGDIEGTYTATGAEKDFAIFYFTEGSKVLCGDSKNGVVNATEKEMPTDNSDQSVLIRDIQREDDISRFLTAVNDFMTNNSGNTPFGNNSGVKTDYTGFVARYIDEGVATANNTQTSCRSDATCKKFTDPDGTLYKIKAMTVADWNAVKSSKKSIDHTVYVAVNAGCERGSDTGAIKSGTGYRQIAMLYVLESGKIYCYDNH